MKTNHLLSVWMLVVAGLSMLYVAFNSSKHPELVGLVLIILPAFMGIAVGLSSVIKKLDDKESKK